MRCLWLQKSQPNKPWSRFSLAIPTKVQAMFAASMISEVGDGRSTLFWSDRWLSGRSLKDLAPDLIPFVTKRAIGRRTVYAALQNRTWLKDITTALNGPATLQFLQVWDAVAGFQLLEGVPDQHRWTPTPSGMFSTRSAYHRFFTGAITFEPYSRIWKTWAPLRAKFFVWLATLNRCWTADRLARRGLHHPPNCPLCDQMEETVQHLLTDCVFAREIWFKTLQRVQLGFLAPTHEDTNFQAWWSRAMEQAPKEVRKGFNSLVILVAWFIWKLRNRCVFDGARPTIDGLLVDIREEARLWCLGGAARLRALLG